MKSTVVFSPAKVNLLLAVTGRRPDGFHDLVSLAAPVAFGDRLWIEPNPKSEEDTLVCDFPGVPIDTRNLVLKAAAFFRAQWYFPEKIRFTLQKRIPPGAGLGGGSSNAAAALKGLNEYLGNPLSLETLSDIATEVGSDCALFLKNAPVILRGRGEVVESLPESIVARLRKIRLLLFKPDFNIDTAWAYNRLRVRGEEAYVNSQRAEEFLESWLKEKGSSLGFLYNSFENEVFTKYSTLPVLVKNLKESYRLPCLMCGSGSACFAILETNTPVQALRTEIIEAWGEETFIVETSVI